MRFCWFVAAGLLGFLISGAAFGADVDNSQFILTPAPPATPRINGPRIYGERPGRPFLYTIPATGDRPMTFSAAGLPDGLKLAGDTGRITGSVAEEGSFDVKLTATNSQGTDTAAFKIVIGDEISLTPAMGWNSWNCYQGNVDQDKVLAAAQAMVASGLIQHGWTYINIDDTWQGERSGPDHVLQADPKKFPDMAGMCQQIHDMGLKAGIYSTPWMTSYARHCGGSSTSPDGAWTSPGSGPKTVNKKILPWAIAQYHFMKQDAKQWADWGFDYLKYDWNPIERPETEEMAQALKDSGRDFIFSLSNSAPYSGVKDWAELSNSWRTGGDIKDDWKHIVSRAFAQDKWAPFAGPGHWNDPDMMEIGVVGPKIHYTNLTPDECYTHMSMWCLLSSPLILGNVLDRMDNFTLSLFTNDEVLALDQDALGKQATQVAGSGDIHIYEKPLADGNVAVGVFNAGADVANTSVSLSDLKLSGSQIPRDLWRQKDLDPVNDQLQVSVPSHGVILLKFSPVR